MKRKVNDQAPTAKKAKESTVKRKPRKKLEKQPKRKTRKPRRLAVYQPEFNQEEQFSSDEEQINSEEEFKHCTQDELNNLARQAYRVGNSKGGIGPRFAR